MALRTLLFATACVGCGIGPLHAQDFPAGDPGKIYYAVRIDQIPAEMGGPLTVELDGDLGDDVWSRTDWQGWSHSIGSPLGDLGAAPEDDLDVEWAAAADDEFLYVAWRVTDEVPIKGESFGCDVWRDDSVELYIDSLNDGPECEAPACYGDDDSQITIGYDNVDNLGDPALLQFGGLAGVAHTCDFSGPAPEIATGAVLDFEEGGGWQAEIAIPLQTDGNNDDGTPTWDIDASHGTVIGFNLHANDDDIGGDRDHKLVWSAKEVEESAWYNPGSAGKLVFTDLGEDLPSIVFPVSDVTCLRVAGGNVVVRWTNGEGADPADPISVAVDGTEVATVAGSESQAVLTPQQVPEDAQNHVIGVTNSSGVTRECTIFQSAFDECGGIRTWALLGAFTGTGAAPGEDSIRQDFMTDGTVGELEFAWIPGQTIATDFGGAASSTGITPAGVPTVQTYLEETSRVGLDGFFGGPDNVMAYAHCTVVNSGADRETTIQVWSDDSIQVILNGEEVGIVNQGRGINGFCDVPQNTFGPVIFLEGDNDLLVKVFDGCCGWEFALRFVNAFGTPDIDGLSVILAPSGAELPVSDLTCERQSDFSVALNWTNPETADSGVETRILVDDVEVLTVAGDATTASLTDEQVPRDGVFHSISVVNNSDLAARCRVAGAPVAPAELAEAGGVLYLNASGTEDVLDEEDRLWQPDEPYLAPAQGATNTATGGDVVDTVALEDGDLPQDVIATERWCDCDIAYQMEVPNDRYEVTLFFAETCVGCVNPNLGGTGGANAARILDLHVEDQSLEMFNQADAADGQDGDGFGLVNVALEVPFLVDVTDGLLDIRIADRGAGNPPENSSIKAICVERVGGAPEPRFKRGDADGVGGILLTDGVYLLNFLFLGGPPPPCLDAADVNDDGDINITTGVYLFNFLFLGGPPPPPPGTTDCGVDGTVDELGCASYDNC